MKPWVGDLVINILCWVMPFKDNLNKYQILPTPHWEHATYSIQDIHSLLIRSTKRLDFRLRHRRDESGDSQDYTRVSIAHHGYDSGRPFFDRHDAGMFSIESEKSESGLLLDERG